MKYEGERKSRKGGGRMGGREGEERREGRKHFMAQHWNISI